MACPLQHSSRNSSTSSLEALHTPDLLTRNNSHLSSSATSLHDEPLASPHIPPKLSTALSSTCLTTALEHMIQTEGGGSWPPTPTYRDSWPHCLHIYHQVATHAPPRFVTPQLRPNYSHAQLTHRIHANRLWLEQSLATVDVQHVVSTLATLHVRARLGLLACIAYLAHLYRWGTLPVVAMAQDENTLALPQSIHAPLRWLNHFYGIQSTGGCLYSMTLLNVVSNHDRLEMAYSNMRHMPYKSVVDAERYNAFVFYQMEALSLQLYRSIAQCQLYLAHAEHHHAADALKQGHVALKAAFRLFFDTLNEHKIKKDVWMSHAQGFHGWGIDGFDGVSGDHSLLVRTLDAFLDIPLRTQPGCPFATACVPLNQPHAACPVRGASAPGVLGRIYRWMWPSTPTCVGEKRIKHIRFSEVPYSDDYLPRAQLNWIRAVRDARLRALASASPDSPVAKEMEHMLATFRLWRMGHTRKAVYYEDLHLEERRPMTASGGVGGGVASDEEGLAHMMERLEARLRARIGATK